MITGRPFDSTLFSLGFTSEHRNIARVVVAGWLGSTQITQLTYGVPEPSTLAFVSVGLVCLWRRHRRTL